MVFSVFGDTFTGYPFEEIPLRYDSEFFLATRLINCSYTIEELYKFRFDDIITRKYFGTWTAETNLVVSPLTMFYRRMNMEKKSFGVYVGMEVSIPILLLIKPFRILLRQR